MNNSFFNLVMIQFREFVREPDVLFWSLVFPLGLSGVLGLAFANQEPLAHQVAVIQNEYAAANATLRRLEAPLSAAGGTEQPAFDFLRLSSEEAYRQLKRGVVTIIVEPRDSARLVYHYDPK